MKLLFCIVSLVITSMVVGNGIHDTYKLYNSLPENEKIDFFTYALAKALTQNVTYSERFEQFLISHSKINKTFLPKFEKYPLERNFLNDMTDFLQRKLQIPCYGLIGLVLNMKFCFPESNNCIDPDDLADFCCPFIYKE